MDREAIQNICYTILNRHMQPLRQNAESIPALNSILEDFITSLAHIEDSDRSERATQQQHQEQSISQVLDVLRTNEDAVMANRSAASEWPDHHEEDDVGEDDFTEDKDDANQVRR